MVPSSEVVNVWYLIVGGDAGKQFEISHSSFAPFTAPCLDSDPLVRVPVSKSCVPNTPTGSSPFFRQVPTSLASTKLCIRVSWGGVSVG